MRLDQIIYLLKLEWNSSCKPYTVNDVENLPLNDDKINYTKNKR